MTSTSTPDDGVHHRPGCTRPGWTSTTAGRAGVHVLRCACCGAVRLVRAGDLKDACAQLSRWVFVKGKVVKGLVNRRVNGLPGLISERALCLQGVAEGR